MPATAPDFLEHQHGDKADRQNRIADEVKCDAGKDSGRDREHASASLALIPGAARLERGRTEDESERGPSARIAAQKHEHNDEGAAP